MAITGSGTVADPYVLNTFTDLDSIGTAPYSLDKHYKLGSDIDASPTQDPGYNSGAGWLPRGDSGTRFTGSFNGNGKTISGLYINRPSTNYVGLIGSTDDAKIYNLTLTNCDITGQNYVGSVLGRCYYGTTFSNLTVYGDVHGVGYVGGILGFVEHTNSITMNSNYFEGSVTGTGDNVGGLVGWVNDFVADYNNAVATVNGANTVGGLYGFATYISGTLTNSSFSGSVVGTGTNIGGIIGYVQRGVAFNGVIVESGSVVTNSGSNDGVGGLIGGKGNETYGVVLTNCQVECTVTGRDSVGGLVGGSRNTKFDTCTFNGTINGRNYVGGFAGHCGYYQSDIIASSVSGVINATGSHIGGYIGNVYYSMHLANLTVDDSLEINVSATSDNVGGIVGFKEQEGSRAGISNCSVSIDITGRDYVGGIGGNIYGENVEGCSYVGTITGRNYCGGMFGRFGFGGSTIEDCTVSGEVKISGSGCGAFIGYTGYGGCLITGLINDDCILTTTPTSDGVGGIVGYDTNGSYRTTYEYCENYMDVSGRHYVGGIVGQTDNVVINSCIAKDISITAVGDRCGAIAGQIVNGDVDDCVIDNCAIVGVNYVGFLSGYSSGTIDNINPSGTITATGSYVGGISGVCNGTYRDCVIASDSAINTLDTKGSIAGIAGHAEGTCLFQDCIVTTNITGQDAVGGIVGSTWYNWDTIDFLRCKVNCTIRGRNRVGGIIGLYDPVVNTSDIVQCRFDGSIIATGNDVGGLCGGYRINIEDSVNYGSVTGIGSVGGLIGYLDNRTVKRSFSKGSVKGNSNVGGLIGAGNGGTVTYSYWDKQTSGQASSYAGTGKTTAEMLLQETYETFDFDTVWAMAGCAFAGYPVLRWCDMVCIFSDLGDIDSDFAFGCTQLEGEDAENYLLTYFYWSIFDKAYFE